MVNDMPRLLYPPRKETRYPLYRRLGGRETEAEDKLASPLVSEYPPPKLFLKFRVPRGQEETEVKHYHA